YSSKNFEKKLYTTVFNIANNNECFLMARTVKDVCEAVWSGMVQEYMPLPEQHWKRIAEDFHRKGAIDGKHVAIQAPSSTGSMYLHRPPSSNLQPVPHVFVGKHLDREKRVFNYRRSRKRRMVECTFGLLTAQWRLYHRVLGVSPKVADAVVKATCILHNFFRFEDAGEEEGSCASLPLEQQLCYAAHPASRQYTTYFSSPAGEVAWQHSVI
uniref:DDE Tnp4 domain-containing protein n=1 Tax=Cyprinus carpio TaxID=7962 RepID=A0A8C1ML89_CYPCA